MNKKPSDRIMDIVDIMIDREKENKQITQLWHPNKVIQAILEFLDQEYNRQVNQ